MHVLSEKSRQIYKEPPKRGRPRKDMSPKTGLARRLQEILCHQDFGATAEIMGVSRETAAKYLRGETAPPPDVLKRIAEATGCDLHWLITGEDRTDHADETEPLYQLGWKAEPVTGLPIVARTGRDQNGETVIEFNSDMHGPPWSARFGLVEVQGDVLAPFALDGHYLLLELPPREPGEGKVVIVQMAQGAALLKRHFHSDDHIVLCDIKPAAVQKPLYVRPDDIDHVHEVMGVLFY